MTIDDLQKKHEFVGLGDQQKAFVVAYCTNGADKVAAANTAYNCKNAKVALATANRAIRHTAISGLISEFFQIELESGTKDEALAMIWKRLQGTLEDKDFVGLMNLYGKWKGFEAPKPTGTPDPPEDPTSIEDLVRELESKK